LVKRTKRSLKNTLMKEVKFIFPHDLDNVHYSVGFAKCEPISVAGIQYFNYYLPDVNVELSVKFVDGFYSYKILSIDDDRELMLERIHNWFMDEYNRIETHLENSQQ